MMRFVATCGAGLEALTAAEVEVWGGSGIETGSGSVSWSGSLESGYRACLWSRFASRILLVVAAFVADGDEQLYRCVREVDWDDHLDADRTFAVDCTLAPGVPFTHSKFVALRVKDAVADWFRERDGRRPNVRLERPDVRLNIHAGGAGLVLSVDLSGESLHRRGYRQIGGLAPLKETLAAAIVALSGWSGEGAFVDPMCGSGTLLIEAALMFGDSAPGLGRTYFGLTGWRGHEPGLWGGLVSEALEREAGGQEKVWPPIVGYEADPAAVHSARANIRRAGLEDRLRVEHGELFSLQPPGAPGCLVCNPPYGERLAEKDIVRYLYRALGNKLSEAFAGWQIGLFTSNPDFADMVGLEWRTSHRLYNGPLACRLFVGTQPASVSNRFRWHLVEGERTGEGSDFANRLRKNLKKRLSWAEREGIDCFRVYDRDMPEYNVSIDLYGKWVHVQEFAPPSTVDEAAAGRRFALVLEAVRAVLGVGRDRVFIKTRRRQRGTSQYQRKNKDHGKLYEVGEGRCRFLVNFTDYLDTGLFLDHRATRSRIGREAGDKRFLNLFGYTGSATVHAALGGAVATTTVDLSPTYLRWAEKNFALNGMFAGRHRLIKADCLDWLAQESGTFDLIFVDPPTFSNTRKKGRIFDVQNQHGRLVRLAMERLDTAGLLIFSSNFKSFQFDHHLQEEFDCRNISTATLPEDFKRHGRVHECWEVRHRQGAKSALTSKSV